MKKSVSKMREIAGNLPRKFISFRHLGFEYQAHILRKEREVENPRSFAQPDEININVVIETSNFLGKIKSAPQTAPMVDENVASTAEKKDCNLIMAERDCVVTSSEEERADLNAFVSEKLQSLCERSLEQIVGDESSNLGDILCGSIDVTEDSRSNVKSVCPEVTHGSEIQASDIRGSPNDNVDRALQEELGSPNVISTPILAVLPIYSKRGDSSVEVWDALPCKSVTFDISGKRADVSRVYATEVSEGVPESNISSGGFSALESIARKQIDEGATGSQAGTGGDGVVFIPPAEELFGQEAQSG